MTFLFYAACILAAIVSGCILAVVVPRTPLSALLEAVLPEAGEGE